MNRRSRLRTLVAVALASCASAPGADSIPVRFELAPDASVSESKLRTLAARELSTFAARRRAADLLDAAQTMERGLRNDGFPSARVTFRMEPSEEAMSAVVFVADTGDIAELRSLTFPGATIFSPVELRERLRTRTTSVLSDGDVEFVRADVDALAEDVRTAYLLAGHLRVRVGPIRVRWNARRTKADVEMPVDEGRRYEVASVEIVGDLPGDLLAAIREAVPLRGKPYHPRTTGVATSGARRALFARGHHLATVEARADVDDDAARARVEVTVVAGPVLRLRSVHVEGLDRTDASFVQERIGLAPGDVADQSAIDRAVDALYATGVFRSVRITPVVAGTAVGPAAPVVPATATPAPGVPRANAPLGELPADLRAAVEELDARSVEYEIGWGSYEQLRGAVRYGDRNLFGAARTFETGVFASTRGGGVSARYEDRFLLGRDWVFGANAVAQEREEPSFDSQLARFEVNARKGIAGGLTLRLAYTFQAEEATNVEGRVPGAELAGFLRTAGVSVQVTRDRRDDPLFPTAGSLVEVRIGRNAPELGSELDFTEYGLSCAAYRALGDDTVIAVGASGSTRDVESSDRSGAGRATLPIQERLFLGGESSVRSFGEDELSPVGRRGRAIGGLTAVEAHVELRQRIHGNIYGALFYDVGAVNRDSFAVRAPFGHAIGTGIRYRSPVGAIRLDVAWNPGDRFAADSRWQVHLSFGFSF